MDKQENTTTVSAPTTDELKERFDARSIPLAIDFANLIDVAEYGRRALGKHPQQNPEPASGLQMVSEGQLTVKLAPNKGLAVDHQGVGINTVPAHGLKLEESALKLAISASNPGVEVVADGVKVKAHAAAGIKVDSNGVGVVANAAKGMVVEAAGVGINTAAAHGLKLEGNALKLAVSASNPGMEVVADGVKVKAHAAAGIKVDANGVGVVANAAKGMVVEAAGVGINTAAAHGLKLEGNALKLAVSASNPGLEVVADGVKVKAHAAAGIKVDSNGVGVVANAAKGMVVEAAGVGINTAAAHGLKLEGNALKLAVSASNPGLEVVADGVKVKGHTAAGIKVDANGVGVNAGNGIACANNQVNIKLAKGPIHNGGGGQGSDNAISGSNGGLCLSAAGLSVDAGNGIEINANGVSVKCYPNWGLGVSESGLWVVPNTGAGVKVDSFGVGVVANAAKGMLVDSNGVGINTAAPYGLKLEANALKLAVSASNPGVEVVTDGMRVKANAMAGVRVDGAGVGVVTNNAKGIAVDGQGIAVSVGNGLIAANNKINIKLAKGDYTNGTESFGNNGTISGPSGGLHLSDNGLSVNPGNGICLDGVGVSIKCAANSALTASENGGLNLNVASNRGLSIENNQLGVKGYDTLYLKVLCDIHRANLFAVSDYVIALGSRFVSGNQNNFVIYFYGRGSAIVSNHGFSSLNIGGRQPDRMQLATAHGYSGNYSQILSAMWENFNPISGASIGVPITLNDFYHRQSVTMSLTPVQ